MVAMASHALRRPIASDQQLSVVGHLDELRARLVVCLVGLVIAFGLCLWQNGRLLDVINHPLTTQTQKHIAKSQGTSGELSQAQRSLRGLALDDRATAAALAAPGSGLSASARAALAARVAQLDRAVAAVPTKVAGTRPVTLGISEPFTVTLLVSGMFALILTLPLILYELYAFLVPAFTLAQRRVAVPLLLMVPVLFCAGVAFGYFLVLPAAIAFLQNFNTDEFNVLVQARDYYTFVGTALLACGIVFQVPVGVLALTRLRVIDVAQLRAARRYAYVACAVVAAALPGVDPVSMLLEMVPLLVLYELSIVLARIFRPHDVETPSAA
jgi:sec-independent protein translocase protein TatC